MSEESSLEVLEEVEVSRLALELVLTGAGREGVTPPWRRLGPTSALFTAGSAPLAALRGVGAPPGRRGVPVFGTGFCTRWERGVAPLEPGRGVVAPLEGPRGVVLAGRDTEGVGRLEGGAWGVARPRLLRRAAWGVAPSLAPDLLEEQEGVGEGVEVLEVEGVAARERAPRLCRRPEGVAARSGPEVLGSLGRLTSASAPSLPRAGLACGRLAATTSCLVCSRGSRFSLMADSRFLMLVRSGLVLGVWFLSAWDLSGMEASLALEELERSRRDSLASTATSSTASLVSMSTSPSSHLPSRLSTLLLSSFTNL